MSDEIINDVLSKNQSFPYKYSYRSLVTVEKNPSNTVKQSFVHDPHDWARYEVFWSQLTNAQRDSMWNFIKAHGANTESFLFRDDFGFGYQVARQTIGTGDGSEDEFQLIQTHTVGSTARSYDRRDIETGSLRIWIDSVEVFSPASWTADLTRSGLVTTAVPVPNLELIEAEYDFDRRVRLEGDLSSILSNYQNTDLPLVLEEENSK